MKILKLILVFSLLLLAGCGKNNVDTLKDKLQENPNDIDNAIALIDNLLLQGEKEEAYKLLVSTGEKEVSAEQLAKLQEFAKSLEIRLYEVDGYRDNLQDYINEIRYDESGRIIRKDEEYRYYPDDGGEVYYYTFGSDCEVSPVRRSFNKYEELIKEELYDNGYYRYDLEYENDRLMKKAGYYVYNGEERQIYIETYTYSNGDLIKISGSDFTPGLDISKRVYEFEYDEHHNVVKKTITYNDNPPMVQNYKNEYDDNFNLIKKTTIDGYTKDRVEKFSYDKIYGVLLEAIEEDGLNLVSKYELVTSSNSIGLNKDALSYASGNATKAVKQRQITADILKVRSEPTVNKDNQVGKLVKGDIVDVYQTRISDKYIWYMIDINKWIADDGTWSRVID